MQRGKEAAALARSAMEKTKATAEEKAEKWTKRDPIRKEMAEEKKDERTRETEREKRDTYDQNAAARKTDGAYSYDTADRGYEAQEVGLGGDFPTIEVTGTREFNAGADPGGVLDPNEDTLGQSDYNRSGRATRGTTESGYGSGAPF